MVSLFFFGLYRRFKNKYIFIHLWYGIETQKMGKGTYRRRDTSAVGRRPGTRRSTSFRDGKCAPIACIWKQGATKSLPSLSYHHILHRPFVEWSNVDLSPLSNLSTYSEIVVIRSLLFSRWFRSSFGTTMKNQLSVKKKKNSLDWHFSFKERIQH